MIDNPESLVDSYGRKIGDLRISVTDRCNFRCLYCLPETEAADQFFRTKTLDSNKPVKDPAWKPPGQILSFEEIERVVRLFVGMGIRKIRLTGGEPLVRKKLEVLIEKIATIPDIEDLALTSNGFLFETKAAALKAAGLKRITFSLDSLDRENFKKITSVDGLHQVFRSVALARSLGFSPIKINCVLIRGMNDHEIENLARYALDQQLPMRFIEYMPLDSSRAWDKNMVIPGNEILERLAKQFHLEPIVSLNRSETARRFRLNSTNAEIGIIAPVSNPFCGHCNRIRLMADGKIRTCLFSEHEYDLRLLLRSGTDDPGLVDFIRQAIWQKEPRHYIGEKTFVQPSRTMSCIGG